MAISNDAHTITSERRNKRLFALEESLSNMKIDSQMEREFNEYNIEKLNESCVDFTTNNSRERNTRVMRESLREAEEKANKYIYQEAIAEIYIKSLPLSEEYVKLNEDELRNKCNGTVCKLYDNNAIQNHNGNENPNCISFENYLDKFSTLQGSIVKYNVNPEECDKSEVECVAVNTSANVSEDVELFSSIIKEKVMNTIQEEKFLASNRKEIFNENHRFDNKTLFNGLNVNAYNQLSLNNNLNESMRMDTDGKILSNAELAFKEAVEDYTLIETLNTLGLININIDSLNESISRLYL